MLLRMTLVDLLNTLVVTLSYFYLNPVMDTLIREAASSSSRGGFIFIV